MPENEDDQSRVIADGGAWLAGLPHAMAYADLIVVESDGYPMLHSANDARTLVINAFMAGQSHLLDS